MNKLGKALLHSSLLLLVLAIGVYFYLDRIVARAVEEGGSRALGVRTDVGGVQMAILRGHVGLTGLEIDNPEGFGAEHFLRLGSIRLEVPPRALLADTVVIPSIALEDLELTLEGSTQGTNYGRILANLGALGGGAGSEPADASAPGAKGFVVKELVVRNVKAEVAMSGLGTRLAQTSIAIPEIRLQDLGVGSSGGLQLAELIGQVTGQVVQAVVRKQPELASTLGAGVRDQLETEAKQAAEGLGRLGGVFQREP
jgi:hypothetical protein